ncbi:hypothetical protein NEF87_001763 [Candidatus Lokiarchaeum ossiferum]|uniref:Major facilitator superfamily (MFS) profile domain-containing protein n=1 Tax=Candidatus Lokiarchaeum ossiferum TaxID=2951803 RepID=A0ABY6HPN0_9ARCH|nr:hypothetical protein NEF87_001763 [Candidatus Lokiarchaeum sp. B-35]
MVSSDETSRSYGYVIKKVWPLLAYEALVGIFISADYINLIYLSNLLWPGESFHALQMGALITVRLWVDGVCALLWGYLADRIKRKTMLSFTSSMTGIMIFLNGFLPVGGGNSNYIWWIIVRGFTGMFMSAGGPIIHSFVSDILQKENRSKYFGLGSLIWGLFPSLFSLASAVVFQLGYWRYYYFSIGLLYIFYSAYMLLRFIEPKRGITEQVLTNVLSNTDVEYKFKISKDTLKSTMLSKTNLLILFEGIFTNVFFGILDLLLLPYIQDAPRNLSPTNSAVLSLTFGLPAALIGPLVFGQLSDKFGKKNIKNRIKMIIFSLIGGFLLVSCFFLVDLPHLSPAEGENISVLWSFNGFVLYGIVIFLARIDFSLFMVNQPAIIQEINLPEAQGSIRSWGQMVEIASYGFGPLLAGILLTRYEQNYQAVIFSMAWLLLPGLLMWFLTFKTIKGDRKRVQELLSDRSKILEENKNNQC